MAQNRIFKPRKGVGLDTSVNKVRDTFLRGEIVLRHRGPRVATKTAESRRDAGDSGAWLLKARVLPFETAAIPAGTKRNKNRAKRSHFPRRDSPSPAPLLLPGAYASRQRAGAARPRAGVGGGGGGCVGRGAEGRGWARAAPDSAGGVGLVCRLACGCQHLKGGWNSSRDDVQRSEIPNLSRMWIPTKRR